MNGALTELSGRFDVHVVEARADAHDDAQAFELVQVVSGQGDGVVQQGAHSLVQHLEGRGGQTDTDAHIHSIINLIEITHTCTKGAIGVCFVVAIDYGLMWDQTRLTASRKLRSTRFLFLGKEAINKF